MNGGWEQSALSETRSYRLLGTPLTSIDACKTYELTWAIRLAAERNRKAKKDAAAAAAPAPAAA